MPLLGELRSRPTYEILRSVHGGRVGELKLCEHRIFGQQCIQKTISILGLEDSIAYREPRLLHDISHPHIVPVYEAQFDPDFSYAITFVMPFYPGGSVLDALEDDYRFSIYQALDIVCHVLDALGFVHHVKSALHRDLKPANVFLDEELLTAYLGDFGSAAYMQTDGTAEGKVCTPLYTPPEAGPDGGHVGIPGDIYGVGLTLWEMLNGRFLYEHLDPPNVQRRLEHGLRALPDSSFASFAPHVPASLRRHVRKAIHRSPELRFQTAGEFIHQLRNRVIVINWRHLEGGDQDGVWEGTWPPGARHEQRRHYRVESRLLARGRGRRLSAFQRAATESDWRRFGVDDTVVVDDRRRVEGFFESVQARAAHLAPAL